MGNSPSTDTEKIDELRLLFTSSLDKLINLYGKNTVVDFLSNTYNKCKRLQYFVKGVPIGAGGFGIIIRYCLDPTCNPLFIMKLSCIELNLYKGQLDDPIRPENVEVIVLSKLNDIFTKLSYYDSETHSPFHVPKLLDAFRCSNNESTNPYFFKLLTVLREFNKTATKPIETFLNCHWYNVTLMEYANLGSIEKWLISEYFINLSIELKDVMFKSIFFQILMTLAIITDEWPSFRHNDLHPGNILLTRWYKPLIYRFKNKSYVIEVPHVKVLIIDFDFATAKNLRNSKYEYYRGFTDTVSSYRDVHKFLNAIGSYIRIDSPTVLNFMGEVVPPFLRGQYRVWRDTNINNVPDYPKSSTGNDDQKIIYNYGIDASMIEMKILYNFYKWNTSMYLPNKIIDHPYFIEFQK
jgi:hypothetical protein